MAVCSGSCNVVTILYIPRAHARMCVCACACARQLET